MHHAPLCGVTAYVYGHAHVTSGPLVDFPATIDAVETDLRRTCHSRKRC
jgi:hypothetical protein